MGIRFRKQTRQPLEGAGGMFALISLHGFQAIIKQICFLFPSFPQAPLFPSVSSCSSQNSPGFSSTNISFPSAHCLQIGLLANPVNILSIFPLLLSGSHWWELTALRQATLADLLGAGPSHCQRNFLDFLKRAGEQTLPKGLWFSLWSQCALACSAVCFRGSPQGLAVLGGDQSFSIREVLGNASEMLE